MGLSFREDLFAASTALAGLSAPARARWQVGRNRAAADRPARRLTSGWRRPASRCGTTNYCVSPELDRGLDRYHSIEPGSLRRRTLIYSSEEL
jgi:hypothetical protein